MSKFKVEKPAKIHLEPGQCVKFPDKDTLKAYVEEFSRGLMRDVDCDKLYLCLGHLGFYFLNSHSWEKEIPYPAAEPVCPFEVGKTYQNRDGDSYTFAAYIPDANTEQRAVFIDGAGDLITRYVDGTIYSDEDCICAGDILPEPPKPKFEPKVGTWETRGGGKAYVLGFSKSSYFPIVGLGCDGDLNEWFDDGRAMTTDLEVEHPRDLIKYLGSLPPEMVIWTGGSDE